MAYQARRALREPFAVKARRQLRVLVPGLAALALIGGIGVASTAGQSEATGQTAVPAAVTSSTGLPLERELRANRSNPRAPISSASTPAASGPVAPAATPTTPAPPAADAASVKPVPVPSTTAPAAKPSATTPAAKPSTATTTTAAPKPAAAPVAPKATGTRWTTADLNLRIAADGTARIVDVVDEGSKVGVTGRTSNGFTEVVVAGASRWVSSQYLAQSEPKPEQEQEQSDDEDGESSSSGEKVDVGDGLGAKCASGSSVERGLQTNTIRAHRHICANWPQIKSYGGVRADSLPEHPSGRALDVMTSNEDLGWEIAKHMQANASEFGITQIIWQQKIWTTQRSGEGWRSMSDRGGSTANHMDHVHLSFR